jgi:hypothetical protein
MSLAKETVIGLATVESVEDGLINRNARFLRLWENGSLRDPDERHPLGQWSSVTTPDLPSVIYDDGAAFCSPIITFDQFGSALHFHDSLIAFKDYGWAQKIYFDALKNYLKGPRVLAAIGGMNVDITEIGQRLEVRNPIDKVIDFTKAQVIQRYPYAEIVSLVARQYDNQERSSDIVPDSTKMRGFVFIPKYLARNNRNHLLGIVDGEDHKLRTAFSIR